MPRSPGSRTRWHDQARPPTAAETPRPFRPKMAKDNQSRSGPPPRGASPPMPRATAPRRRRDRRAAYTRELRDRPVRIRSSASAAGNGSMTTSETPTYSPGRWAVAGSGGRSPFCFGAWFRSVERPSLAEQRQVQLPPAGRRSTLPAERRTLDRSPSSRLSTTPPRASRHRSDVRFPRSIQISIDSHHCRGPGGRFCIAEIRPYDSNDRLVRGTG